MAEISFHIVGTAEGTLTKLGIHVLDLKKLVVGRAQSTDRSVWKQCVIKVSRLVCGQYFISEHSNVKFNSFSKLGSQWRFISCEKGIQGKLKEIQSTDSN